MKEAEVIPQGHEDRAELFANIDTLVDHTMLIYELNSKEGAAVKSIESAIVTLLKTLRTSLQVSPEIFHTDFPAIKNAILNSNGEVIIIQVSGDIITRKLAELSARQVVDIIREIVPKLNQGAEAMMVASTENISALKRIAKQFQRVKVQPSEQPKDEEMD